MVQFLWQPYAALISERVGETRFMVGSLLVNVVVAVPMFLMISTARPALVLCGIALGTVSGSGYYAVLAGFLARAFPSRVRYTGISLSCQLFRPSSAVRPPLVAQALLTSGGGSIWPVVAFNAVLLPATTACVAALARSTARRTPQEARPVRAAV
ncbi:hypothetical protein [Streptomyces sp. SCL15-6]|uniref:hypothetical protein n=1 Tax=Streptomyces sp. SCL15-6 TaxID=2967222 RepID=UPI00296732ED|nr:hypothetical protein [Streptomyces sp. SCL15-6]